MLNIDKESDAESPAVTGLYVDVENLQENSQAFLCSVIENWPSDISVPSPEIMYLYVRADLQLVWQIWANNQFPKLEVVVKGVQRFSRNQSKNSADIALCLDAISDFLANRVQHVATVSDDSDFMALFGKIRELHIERQGYVSKIPFLWLMTDRAQTVSPVIHDFSSNDYIRIIRVESDDLDESNHPPLNVADLVESTPDQSTNSTPSNDDIAKIIIRTLPLGEFKSTQCKEIIKKHWSDHKLAQLGNAQFGIQFSADIVPVLKMYKVLEPNPSRKPKRYEITEEAKRKAS